MGAAVHVKSKADHQALWGAVEAMAKEGLLPQMADLDSQMLKTWDHLLSSVLSVSAASSSGEPSLPQQECGVESAQPFAGEEGEAS